MKNQVVTGTAASGPAFKARNAGRERRTLTARALMCAMLFFVFSASAGAEIRPVAGFDVSPLLSFGTYNNWNTAYWELAALYPFAGLEAEWGDVLFRLSAHAGGGLSFAGSDKEANPDDKGYFYWTYQYGGTLTATIGRFIWNDFLIGMGGGMSGAKLEDEHKRYPFIRGEIGSGSLAKLYFDYNLEDNGVKFGVLLNFAFVFSGSSHTPTPHIPFVPAPNPAPSQKPRENPTITPEELRKVDP